MELLCCNYTFNYGGGANPVLVVTSIVSAFAAIFALWVSYQNNIKNLNAKKQEEEKKEIQKRLDEFYGPFYQLRKKSHLIYEKFRENYNSDSDFSTLTYLLDGKKFSKNEEELLNEIIKIGEECEKLIHSKAGLIDDTNLRTNIIPRASTHFLILRLAHKGSLIGDVEKFKSHVFPKELDDLLEKRRGELEQDLIKLNKI